jgi:hypothetical protein
MVDGFGPPTCRQASVIFILVNFMFLMLLRLYVVLLIVDENESWKSHIRSKPVYLNSPEVHQKVQDLSARDIRSLSMHGRRQRLADDLEFLPVCLE